MFNFIKRDYYIIFFTIIFIFCLDRFTKEYVIYLSNQNLNSEIYISEYLNIFLIWNDGIAFGLFSDNNQILYNIISSIILLIITILFYLMIKAKRFKKLQESNQRKSRGFVTFLRFHRTSSLTYFMGHNRIIYSRTERS